MAVYKILLPGEWDAFDAAGRFDGSAFDQESGFIHLSSRGQVAETARRVFTDQPALVIAVIDENLLNGPLLWEIADRGVFPHLYGTVPRSAVTATVVVAGAAEIEDALPH